MSIRLLIIIILNSNLIRTRIGINRFHPRFLELIGSGCQFNFDLRFALFFILICSLIYIHIFVKISMSLSWIYGINCNNSCVLWMIMRANLSDWWILVNYLLFWRLSVMIISNWDWMFGINLLIILSLPFELQVNIWMFWRVRKIYIKNWMWIFWLFFIIVLSFNRTVKIWFSIGSLNMNSMGWCYLSMCWCYLCHMVTQWLEWIFFIIIIVVNYLSWFDMFYMITFLMEWSLIVYKSRLIINR